MSISASFQGFAGAMFNAQIAANIKGFYLCAGCTICKKAEGNPNGMAAFRIRRRTAESEVVTHMKRLSRFPSSFHSALAIGALAACAGLVGTTAAVLAQSSNSSSDLELAFNGHCRECHAFDKGDNRLGPSLYGVVGRKAGIEPGFSYSDSLKSSGITWNEKNLDKWITNPNALVPGNNMGAIFGGVADAGERAKIIAFLKQDTTMKGPGAK
jgi:cytochrome c